MASDVLLDVMLSLPSPLHTPSLESELAVVVPPAHMPSPLTPVRSLGEGQALATGRRSSPSKSAKVIHPRVWTCRGPFITPCSAWGRSFRPCSAEGHASSPRSLPFVREQRSVDHAQAWGRCPATRVRGRVGSVGTTLPSDGIIRPCARQPMRQEEIK